MRGTGSVGLAAPQRLRVVAIGSVLSLVISALATLGASTIAWAGSNCGSPNYYALGTDTVGQRWGAEGHESSYNVSIKHTNYAFSDQALHGGGGYGTGLEVGWYVGWGNQTQSYVTYPHVYATANGPREVDGPYIGQQDDYYHTWWDGSGDEYYYVSHNGTTFFYGLISTAGYNGPGYISAVGEVNINGDAMKGNFYGLEHMWSSYTWYNWTGIHACADPGYSVYNVTNTSMKDD